MPSSKSGDIVDSKGATSGTKSPEAGCDEELQFDKREMAIDGPGAANQRAVEPRGVPAKKLWFGLGNSAHFCDLVATTARGRHGRHDSRQKRGCNAPIKTLSARSVATTAGPVGYATDVRGK
jgi:hypothetical protein